MHILLDFETQLIKILLRAVFRRSCVQSWNSKHCNFKSWQRFFMVCFLSLCSNGLNAYGEAALRTHEPPYENPFDMSTGGASLTRATQDGALFSNPSLPAFGAGTIRWIYGRMGVHVGKDSVQSASEILKSGAPSPQNVQARPVYAGAEFSFGVVTSFLGFGTYFVARTDLRKTGEENEVPIIQELFYGNGGAIITASTSFSDLIALGIGLNYAYEVQADPVFGAQEFAEIAVDGNAALQKYVLEKLKGGHGLSKNAGLTLQKRTRYLDLRIAASGQDLAGTKYVGNLETRKQVLSAGAGLTLHTRGSALHCAADLRDVQKAYAQDRTKRTHLGCKLLLASRVGIGAGLYQGHLSYGLVANLTLLRLEAGYYKRELGSKKGEEPRGAYFLATGFEIP
jgi:hypothetical protein